MPPLARPKTEAMADLADRLMQHPPGVLRACADRAERLAGEIDPQRLYPEDWVLYRILDERMDIAEPRMLVGAAVLTDLSALVERVCEAARLNADELDTEIIVVADLEKRWAVSKKTIDRYRRMGLIARRVDRGGGRQRLVFTRGAVESFEARHADRLARARRFSRLTPEQDEQIARRAGRYRRRFNMSLNEVAQRLAKRFGRSHEGVRQLLKRNDARLPVPLFGEVGPPSNRGRRTIHRAMRRGIEPSRIAERLDRSKASVLRAYNEHRADLLRSLDLGGTESVEIHRPELGDMLLENPLVRSGLAAAGSDDLASLLRLARKPRTPIAVEESARVRAAHVLRARAQSLVDAMGRTTAEPERIDEAETILRWISRLKAVLLVSHLRLVVETIESRAGGALEQIEPRLAVRAIRHSLRAASGAIDAFDPEHGGRLAARVGLAVDRATQKSDLGRPPQRTRAARRIAKGVPLGDWTLMLDAWQTWLSPDPRFRAVLGSLGDRHRLVLTHRYGLGDDLPQTLGQIADRLDTPRMHAARYERQAIRAALIAARSL